MNDQVKKVRESIKQRKKTSPVKNQKAFKKMPLFPSNEERLGMMETTPTIMTADSNKTQKKSSSGNQVKYVAFPLIFFIVGILILSSSHPSIHTTKMWLHQQLEDEFPFAKVNQWYVTTFGQPNSLVPTNSLKKEEDKLLLPAEGAITETFAVNGNGIKISPNDKTSVTTFTDGIVTFAGNLKETGKTVVIQHVDESISTYGFLSDIQVFVYQLVNKNDKIGETNPSESSEPLFFSIEKNNEYIDPVKVIPVDDIP